MSARADSLAAIPVNSSEIQLVWVQSFFGPCHELVDSDLGAVDPLSSLDRTHLRVDSDKTLFSWDHADTFAMREIDQILGANCW